MAQLDQFRQRMRDLVRAPVTALSSSPTSNRMDGIVPNNDVMSISVVSKPAMLHNKTNNKGSQQNVITNDSLALSESAMQQLNAEEIEILQKIEQQNRLLEADKKSLKSVSSEGGHSESRRSSNGSASPTSMHSAGNDTNSNQSNDTDNKTWNLWGKIVNNWNDYQKKNGKQLKEMIRMGIPHHFRGLAWQHLCNAHCSTFKEKYSELLRQNSPSEKLIRRDIARTYPEQEFFRDKDGIGQEVLFNVIKAYSLVDREVGYCQGSAFIVGLLLMQMPEEEAFAVFVCLMKEYRLRELFKPSMAELGLCMFQLENMLQEQAPDLFTHFQAQGFHTSMFASPWFLTLFATTFDLNLASRVLDVFISEGMEIIFRLSLALLLSSEKELLAMDMEGMLKHITKDLPSFYNKDPNLLFQRAFALVKYNPKKVKRLEKEYMTMRSKEHEEQVEMRRLRTENRLLRQRLDELEAENGQLADKLIQDRVNRALEAEEKIIMGKELSIAKRQARLGKKINNPASQDEETKPPSSPQHSETFIMHLQQQLVQAKLQEAEAASTIVELQVKLCDLREKNRELVDQSKVTSLQEELIAVKMREAESNLSMKELAHKFHQLEDNWQKHMSRMASSRRTTLTSSKHHKVALQELQEEVLSSRFRETKISAELAEGRHRIMELETANHVCNSQLRRSDEDRSLHKERSRVAVDNERVLRQELNEVSARLAHTESKNQEALMSLRLREADNSMEMAELKQEISSLKVKLSETSRSQPSLTGCNGESTDSSEIIHQLQRKVLKQQRMIDSLRSREGHITASSSECSDDGDLLFDATITSRDSPLLIDTEGLTVMGDADLNLNNDILVLE
ncbi:EVI5-like protein [Ciona intestinalis]